MNEKLLNTVKSAMSGLLPVHKVETIAPKIAERLGELQLEAIKEFAHLLIDKDEKGVIHTMDIPDFVREMEIYDPYKDTFEKGN